MRMFTKQRNFSLTVFSTLSGFLVANIFGTFLTVLRSCLGWDGFVVIGLIFFVEAINLSVYRILRPSLLRSKELRAEERGTGVKNLEGQDSSRNRSRMGISKTLKPLTLFLLGLSDRRSFLVCQLINSFKLGLLLGFFVEAFKVGS
jgi:hypothetical protein